MPPAAMHHFCTLLLQIAAVDDNDTFMALRSHAYSSLHMKNLVLTAQMQADLVWAAAPRNMTKEVQKEMLDHVKQGEQDKAKKTAMKQLRVEYMDTYDYQRFMQWWSDEAVPMGKQPLRLWRQ